MPRRPAPTRHCDAPGCTVPVKRGILMCREHWYRLPKELRSAINQTWAAGHIRAWSSNCLEARNWLLRNPPGALAARITGERDA